MLATRSSFRYRKAARDERQGKMAIDLSLRTPQRSRNVVGARVIEDLEATLSIGDLTPRPLSADTLIELCLTWADLSPR